MTKVLIVDDEPIIREVVREFFELENFVVTEAESGHEALEFIDKETFDCVISDVRMPNGDGIELAKQLLKRQSPKPKLVLITGYSDIGDYNAKELGVQKIIFKPFVPDQLISAVKECLI